MDIASSTSSDNIRYESTAAVALNQLRYHTRAAGNAVKGAIVGSLPGIGTPIEGKVHNSVTFEEVELI